MGYLVTGATGFIGRHLVAELGARGQPIWVLVRAGSRVKLEQLTCGWGECGALVRPLLGELSEAFLGVAAAERESLRGQIQHFFHLGALYDLSAEASDLERANVAGTRNALQLAQEIGAGCFHLVSSIAVAGRYRGTFTEQMFEEANGLDHPYFRTKHQSEALVRDSCRIPWRVYRPGMVVGHSGTGVMDKVDGPYYLFKVIQKVRDHLPRWVPLLGFQGGHINLVPVDFVAGAISHLAHLPELDGRCFHLTDPKDRRVGEVLNLFAKAAHAPTMRIRFSSGLLAALSQPAVAGLQFVQPIIGQTLQNLGIPKSVIDLLDYPTSFDSRQTQALLAPAGIRVPALEDYAWRLWDFWERHLDAEQANGRHLAQTLRNKCVLITGGSSGIGRATAREARCRRSVGADCSEATQAKLGAVRAEIESQGGRAASFTAAILADSQACDQFIARLQAEYESIDILINNAGRSIRRAIDNSYDRLHDYERLMSVNYFAAVRMTLGLLPAMVRRGAGHVINISSIGVLTNAPRFSSYNASKAALESFSRCAAAEYAARGIRFTVINLPLVKTPMVAPTKIYDGLALMQPEQAADLICEAIVRRPERLATPLGNFAQLVEVLAPGVGRAIMSENFRIFPESTAAGGGTTGDKGASPEMLAFAALTRGIHW